FISVHLQGLNDTVWYKGFVIQPFEWNNGQLGQRMGQLMRLDDNGSCASSKFQLSTPRFKNSATHSHDEKKKHIRLWWKIDEDSRTVQLLFDENAFIFRATVVKHQTMFWVKSVLSPPIPPCRVSKNGIENYEKPLPTPPPPVKQFKMDTNRVFGGDRAALPSVTPAPAPVQAPPQPAPAAVIPVVRSGTATTFNRGRPSTFTRNRTNPRNRTGFNRRPFGTNRTRGRFPARRPVG
ncbi:hypothetical protein COOONC_06981, partial [Cooperia oncophora]